MNICVSFSSKTNISESVSEVKYGLSEIKSKAIIYFASSNYNQEELSSSMQKAFPEAKVFGCSTSGEIVSGKMLKNSIVAMGLDEQIIADSYIELVENISDLNQVDVSFKNFEKHIGTKMSDLDFEKYFGIVLMDGMSGCEEKVTERISNFTDISFVGGSAGDDLKFKQTWVYANGKAYSNAAILAVFKSNKKFEIIKTQSFVSLNKKLCATKVDEKNREVISFDGKKAIDAYAEALNTSHDEISNKFMSNPVGIVVDRAKNDIFVRSPQQIIGGSLKFYCNILEGMEVEILQSTNIVEDTQKAVNLSSTNLGGLSGIINFHCILRTLELESKNITQSYADVFQNIPTIGFSTYGEAYIGHINQTSTMIAFAK